MPQQRLNQAGAAPPAAMSTVSNFMPGTGLCDDCKGLRLDDEGCGGFMGTSRRGTPALRIKMKGLSRSLMLQGRTDSSPDFPKLAKSTAAGCGFCGFLRSAIFRANIRALGKQEEVSIYIYYHWGPRIPALGEEAGLQALVARVHNAHGEEVSALRFNVYSRDSTYRQRQVRGSLNLMLEG
jgi:hypothetical protein